MAMTLVSTVTVGAGGAASIEFTGIAGTGKDLLLLLSARSTTGSTVSGGYLRFNNDTNVNNYIQRNLRGTGSGTPDSQSQTADFIDALVNGNTTTANTFSSHLYCVSNYTSSSAKSVSVDMVIENNATDSRQIIYAASWVGTSAITSLQLSGITYAQHTTASLYIIS